MTVAFVLAGGGSLAAAQVGMLRALFEKGVRPDLLVGVSAGGINAFCFAQHPTAHGLDRLQRLWSRLRRRDVMPVDLLRVLAGLAGIRDGLVPPDRLRSFLHRQIGSALLDDTRIPTHVVATEKAAARHTVHLLPAPALAGANPFDFRATDELIEAGYRAATRMLAHGEPPRVMLTDGTTG